MAALYKKDKNQIKKSLGQKGFIKPSLYKIAFPEHFKKVFIPLGTRLPNIREAVHSPTLHEHLFLNKSKKLENGYSIYFKNVIQKNPYNNFTLIILTEREGYKQFVLYAWRLYHAEFKNVHFSSPIDFLKNFSFKYGLDIVIDGEKNKFFSQKVTHIKGKNRIFDTIESSSDLVISGFIKEVKEMRNIAYVFAIDLNKYKYDLKKHGVKIQE